MMMRPSNCGPSQLLNDQICIYLSSLNHYNTIIDGNIQNKSEIQELSAIHFLVLDLFEDVWVVYVVFYWVCDGVVSLYVVVVEERASAPSDSLILNLFDHVITIICPVIHLFHMFLLHQRSIIVLLVTHR